MATLSANERLDEALSRMILWRMADIRAVGQISRRSRSDGLAAASSATKIKLLKQRLDQALSANDANTPTQRYVSIENCAAWKQYCKCVRDAGHVALEIPCKRHELAGERLACYGWGGTGCRDCGAYFYSNAKVTGTCPCGNCALISV